MTQFPWRMFKGGNEIVFPEGARRFVDVDIRPISHSGAVERTIDGVAVWTGDPAFRLHEVSISCSDQTQAPIADLWPGQTVEIELPVEFSVRGPNAMLPHAFVAGSVYGVSADDTEVGRHSGSGRAISIDGAVAIRYRPRLSCIVVERGTDGTQNRGNAGWSLTLEEIGPVTADEDDTDYVKIAALPLQTIEAGSDLVIDIGALTSTNTGKPIQYSLDTSLPGLSISSYGILEWDGVPAGTYAVGVIASSGGASAIQTVAVLSEQVSAVSATGGQIVDEAGSDGLLWRYHIFANSGQLAVSRGGDIDVLVVAGGGAGGNHRGGNAAGGGGGGGVVRDTVVASSGSHTIVVGAGGAATAGVTTGANGSDSSAFGLTAKGGGGGGAKDADYTAPSGGSGGGGRGAVPTINAGLGGAPIQANQGSEWTGQPGATGVSSSTIQNRRGGGGGGFSGYSTAPDAGDGYFARFLPPSLQRWLGGGGGGGAGTGFGRRGVGGAGGGGAGGYGSTPAESGAANTGGGGGGSSIRSDGSTIYHDSGSGGSGIVIIRYRVF